MKERKVLTPGIKSRITRDWHLGFPALGIYKPMRLIKRHGPLLVGICLERSSSNDEYTPLFHVHNLLSPFPVVSLGLSGGIPEEGCLRLRRCIRVSDHERDHPGAILKLGEQFPVLREFLLTWGDLVSLYADYLRQLRDAAIAREFRHGFADLVLLARWCGHLEYASRVLEEAAQILAKGNWVPNPEAWKREVEDLGLNRTMLETALQAEIARHGLAEVPVYPLDDSGDAELITDVYRTVWDAA